MQKIKTNRTLAGAVRVFDAAPETLKLLKMYFV